MATIEEWTRLLKQEAAVVDHQEMSCRCINDNGNQEASPPSLEINRPQKGRGRGKHISKEFLNAL